jgi:predicted nucleotidyltransferase
MIDLGRQHLDRIAALIRVYLPKATLLAFGSRVGAKPTPKPWSDIDIAIKAPGEIPFGVLDELRDVIAGTSIPVRVDLVDYWRADAAFRAIIDETAEPIP